MTHNVELEIRVIKRFINEAKQDRYIQFVSSPKTRHKFIRDLSHFNFLKRDLFNKVGDIEGDTIIETLQKNHVDWKTCYVISENIDIDTKVLDVQRAVNETVGFSMGTILVFGNAEMIFYECETMNTRFMSKKVYDVY